MSDYHMKCNLDSLRSALYQGAPRDLNMARCILFNLATKLNEALEKQATMADEISDLQGQVQRLKEREHG